MKVVVPFTDVSSETRDALAGVDAEYVDVSSSDDAYWNLLSDLWTSGADFVVVEQDIVVHPTALDELDACPYDWCAFPYGYGHWGLHYGLGCVKFSGALIKRNPDAILRVGVMSDGNHEKRHWCRLDCWLQEVVLPGNGEHMHKHETVVKHLGHGNSHGCI